MVMGTNNKKEPSSSMLTCRTTDLLLFSLTATTTILLRRRATRNIAATNAITAAHLFFCFWLYVHFRYLIPIFFWTTNY